MPISLVPAKLIKGVVLQMTIMFSRCWFLWHIHLLLAQFRCNGAGCCSELLEFPSFLQHKLIGLMGRHPDLCDRTFPILRVSAVASTKPALIALIER